MSKLTKKEIAVLKYMDLRIKGFGLGLTDEEITTLQNLPKDVWKAVDRAIIELGGTLPNGKHS